MMHDENDYEKATCCTKTEESQEEHEMEFNEQYNENHHYQNIIVFYDVVCFDN